MLMGYIEEKHAFGVPEVKEVIADVQREMAYPEYLNAPPAHALQPGKLLAEAQSIENETALMKMNERITDLERSVTTVLKLLREMLSLSSVQRKRGEDHS
jgi:general secretion pathway protein A